MLALKVVVVFLWMAEKNNLRKFCALHTYRCTSTAEISAKACGVTPS